MTPAEVARLIMHVTRSWPRAPLGSDAGDAWAQLLAPVDAAAAIAAIDRWTGEFPPAPQWVRAQAMLAAQGPVPGFEELQAFLARHVHCLPYGETDRAQDTVLAVERLAAAGAHEALLRFVAAHGSYAVRMMPDPTVYALDPNQQADRRDMARDYSRRVLADYTTDPRFGVSLERACRAAGLNHADRPQLRRPTPAELRVRREQRQLPAPASADDGPMVAPEDVLGLFERQAAATRFQRKLRAAARRADQEREDADVQSAERELAEHARRREQEAGRR